MKQNGVTVRHIPDEELHAYLDQALSRSQCIEIETHLARCARCRDARDEIAALRDRTTAMLALVAPRRVMAPPVAGLLARAEERRRVSWRRAGMLAASLVAAAMAGWGMRVLAGPGGPATSGEVIAALATSQPEVTLPAEEAPGTPREAVPDLTGPVSPPSARNDQLRMIPVAVTTTPEPAPALPVPGVALRLTGSWQEVSAPEARRRLGAFIPDLPDHDVQAFRVLPVDEDRRPAVVVELHDAAGRPVWVVEGPVEQVGDLTAQAGLNRSLRSSLPARSAPDYLREGTTVRRAGRVLAVLGQMSEDSLNGLAERVVMR